MRLRGQPSCRAISVTFSTAGQMRKETALLNDVSQLSPDGADGLVIQRKRIDRNPSAGGRNQPGHHPQDRCLAAAARSQQNDHFAGLDGKI